MRNLKKILALVLALVMSLSLVTMANADFSDAADIDYKEAVEVMAKIGVLEGADGKFDPKGTLTREQAAKILTYVVLGTDKAAKLTAAVAPFADVAANRWSAGAIAYCASEGIIAGVGEGLYNPTGKLTGAAFGKMLLVALGFDADENGLVGANWEVNVAKLLVKEELNIDGLVLSNELTREQAAQMALNAVKYTNTPDSYVVKAGDAIVGEFDTLLDATLYAKILGAGYTTEKAAAKDSLLKKVFAVDCYEGSYDSFGRPATVYSNAKWDASLTFAAKADFTFTTAMKEKDVFKAIGAAGEQGAYDKYITMTKISINGKDETAGSAAETAVIAKNDSSNAAGFGNGVTVEIFKTSKANEFVMVSYNEFIGTVSSITKANADKGVKRAANIVGVGSFETADFAAGDIVLYTIDKNGIASMKAPATISGKVTKITSAGVYTIGGQDVVLSQDAVDTLSINAEGTWYVDSCGNVIKVKDATATVWEYGYLVKYQSQKAASASLVGSGSKTNEEKLQIVTAKGEKVVFDGAYTVDKDGAVTKFVYTQNATETAQTDKAELVRYTVNADGKINQIEAVTDTVTGEKAVAAKTATKNVAKFNNDYVTDNTLFIAYKDATHYAVYTGYKNIPSTLVGSAYEYFYVTKDGTTDATTIAAVVLTVATTETQSDVNLVWFAGLDNNAVTTADGTVYTYTNVYMNGVKGEIKFLTSVPAGLAAGTLYEYTTNNDGYATIDASGNYGKLDVTCTIEKIESGYYATNHSNDAFKTIYIGAETEYYQVDADTKAVEKVAGLPALSSAYDVKQILAMNDDPAFTADTPAEVVYFVVVAK